MSKLSIYFLIDALPWTLVERTGFLDGILPSRRSLETILGYSSGALPTLFTGHWPRDHGHWAMYLHSPSTSPFGFLRPLGVLGPLAERARVRTWADRRLRKSGEVEGYFSLYSVPIRRLPLFDLCERKDIFAPRAFPGIESIFDLIAKTSHRVWTWRTPEEANRKELLRAIESGRYRHLFFYSAHLDGVMHGHGVRSEKTAAELESYQKLIIESAELARRHYEDVEVCVLSDHGMKDAPFSFDLLATLQSLPIREGRDYVGFFDSTMGRFWPRDHSAYQALRDHLSSISCGRLLTSEDFESLGLDFEDNRYGDLVFVIEAGTQIVPSYMGARAPRAMHGYLPDDPDSSGVFCHSIESANAPSHIREVLSFWKAQSLDEVEDS